MFISTLLICIYSAFKLNFRKIVGPVNDNMRTVKTKEKQRATFGEINILLKIVKKEKL